MELMDESLTSFLERTTSANPFPLPLHIQVDIGHDVAQALSHLHRHEVLHRDLSSNNVLMIGSRRAKVTDFGMARLLGANPRLTQTYCPGTSGYMSPKALADPPNYTTKLDIFSCCVLLVQLVTRKWPNPGPRAYTAQVSDPRFPSQQVLVLVPEFERRREHLDLAPPNHPLQQLALMCIKDKEEERPTADQLCSDLVALKKSAPYQNSLQQAPEEVTVRANSSRDQEVEQQLRESELRVEELMREVQQLHLKKEEDTMHGDKLQRQTKVKDEEVQQLFGQICQLQQENHWLQARGRESEQVVAALQQSVEQKDAEIRTKDWLLQEKEREIGDLQQRVKGGTSVAPGPLKLKWVIGPPAPFETCGHSVAVSGDLVYCRDGASSTKVLMFKTGTEHWKVLPECPKQRFSVAAVNGQLVAIGGRHLGKDTSTLLSLSQDKPDISQWKWLEQLPSMTYSRRNPVVATTNASLIVAGGWEKREVEAMDAQTLQWSTVATLPHPLSEATATVCGGRLYLAGGFSTAAVATKSVLECEVKDLLKSQPLSLASRIGLSKRSQVWREVAPLPVKHSSLVTFQGRLLAVGGITAEADSTSEVRE